MHPILNLPPRLTLCAAMVNFGAKIADIGTDHAYLPIFLAQKKHIKHAVACDISKGPLCVATRNIIKYGVQNIVTVRQCSGLSGITPNEADTVVIAGMGAGIIIEILKQTPWLKNVKKQLILSSMSRTPELRVYLANEGFCIKEEHAAIDQGRAYTVICANFCNAIIEQDALYPFIGGLKKNLNEAALMYIKGQIKHMKNQINGGLKTKKDALLIQKLLIVSQKLENLISS